MEDKKGLNAHLPEGLCVHECRSAPLRSAGNACRLATYQITIKDGFFDQSHTIYDERVEDQDFF